MPAYYRNEDGSETAAEPLGWQGGYDWEVYADKTPMEALLYDEDVLIARAIGRTRLGLALAMRREQKRLGITKVTVF